MLHRPPMGSIFLLPRHPTRLSRGLSEELQIHYLASTAEDLMEIVFRCAVRHLESALANSTKEAGICHVIWDEKKRLTLHIILFHSNPKLGVFGNLENLWVREPRNRYELGVFRHLHILPWLGSPSRKSTNMTRGSNHRVPKGTINWSIPVIGWSHATSLQI